MRDHAHNADSFEDYLRVLIRTAFAEDLAYGSDITSLGSIGVPDSDLLFSSATSALPEGSIAISTAHVVARSAGVASALGAIPLSFRVMAEMKEEELGFSPSLAGHVQCGISYVDGESFPAGALLATISAPTIVLLTAERTFLNIVTHACGIATHTAEWVRAVHGTSARIRDSRKTLPGLRRLQKYSVEAGGGVNHRLALGDEILIKDNHVAAAGGVVSALLKARAYAPGVPCEVEVDTLEQYAEVLPLEPDIIMLDNFSVDDTRMAVDMRAVASLEESVKLESSGGLSLDVAHAYATCGVDYLAVGALTHSTKALDIGLDFSAL